MAHRLHRLAVTRTLGVAVAGAALCLTAAAPATAAPATQFNGAFGGSLQVTATSNGSPTAAFYSGVGVVSVGGASHMAGNIAITGPASCAGGFTATHADTITTNSGDQVSMTISEKSCPRDPANPTTYDCTGTFTITGGSGRFSTATGSGSWAGVLTFTSPSGGDFRSGLSGTIST